MGQQYRWGGLAAIGGAVLFIFVFLFVGLVVGADASIGGFPAVRAGRTIENGLYLAVLVLWVAPMLVLYRALRDSSPGTALFASVTGILGLTVLASGALPHAASVGIADLYHASGGSEADRAILAAVWQGNQAILNMLLVTGLAIVPIGIIGMGFAMRASPAFGSGRPSLALGVIGLAAAVVLLVDPLSPVAVIGFLAMIAFNLAVGWKLYALSREPMQRAPVTAQVRGRSAG